MCAFFLAGIPGCCWSERGHAPAQGGPSQPWLVWTGMRKWGSCFTNCKQNTENKHNSIKVDICSLITNFCATDCWLFECFWRACVGVRSSYVSHHPTSSSVELLSRLPVKKTAGLQLIDKLLVICVYSNVVVLFFSLDRPLNLPLRSLLVVETFSISSSVSLDHSSSTLR